MKYIDVDKIEIILALRKLAKRLSFGGRLLLAQRVLRRLFIGTSGVARIDDFDGDLSINLRLSEHMQSRIFWVNYYSRDIVALLNGFLRPGMTVIDIGANIGEITMVAAKRVGTTGQVLAFEPIDRIAEVLEENVRGNALDWVRVIRAGVSDTNGSTEIYASCGQGDAGDEHHGLGSLYGGGNDALALQTIRLTTLDAFLEANPVERLDLVKIDIEGAELPCLRGALNTLKRYQPTLIIEVQAKTASSAGYRQADILDYLAQLNYSFRKIGPGGHVTPLHAHMLSDYQNVLCVPGSSKPAHGTMAS